MYGTIRKPHSIEEGNTQNNMQQTDLKFCWYNTQFPGTQLCSP